MAQSILTNAAVSTGGRVLGAFLGLATVVVTTQYLGPSMYGTYTALFSFGAILLIVADFGLYLALTRDIAQYPERQQEVYRTMFSVRVALLAAVFLAGVVLVAIIPSYRPVLLVFMVLAVGFMFQSLSQLLMGIYQTYGVVWRATVGDLAGRLVQLVLIAAMLYGTGSVLGQDRTRLLGIVAAFTAGSALAYFLHAWLVPRIKPVSFQFSWDAWKRLLRSAWPLAVPLLLNVIYFRIDAVMLSFWQPAHEVGWYGLAYKIIESLLFFPAMLGGLLLPHLSYALVHQKEKAVLLLNQALRLVLFSTGLVIVTGLFYARDIVIFIGSTDFAAAAPLLQVLIIALAFMFFGNIFGYVLVASHKQKFLLKLYLWLAVGNVLANVVAIPLFGAVGAAMTTLVTEATATLVAALILYRDLPFTFSFRAVNVAVLAAAVAIVAIFIIPNTWPVVVRIALVSLLYAGAGWALGFFQKKDLHLLLAKQYDAAT